jgi:hypothetical protein
MFTLKSNKLKTANIIINAYCVSISALCKEKRLKQCTLWSALICQRRSSCHIMKIIKGPCWTTPCFNNVLQSLLHYCNLRHCCAPLCSNNDFGYYCYTTKVLKPCCTNMVTLRNSVLQHWDRSYHCHAAITLVMSAAYLPGRMQETDRHRRANKLFFAYGWVWRTPNKNT